MSDCVYLITFQTSPKASRFVHHLKSFTPFHRKCCFLYDKHLYQFPFLFFSLHGIQKPYNMAEFQGALPFERQHGGAVRTWIRKLNRCGFKSQICNLLLLFELSSLFKNENFLQVFWRVLGGFENLMNPSDISSDGSRWPVNVCSFLPGWVVPKYSRAKKIPKSFANFSIG